MYLNNLNNFVCDENRTVTYKWLSNVLSVPSDLAKKMLYAFVKQQGNNVQAIYAISGNNKKTQQHEFRLVPSTKLEDTKQEFDPILSLHVYSVQKSLPKDSASLWNVEYEQFNEFVTARKLESYIDNRWSGIKYDYERRKGTEGRSLGTGAVAQPTVKSEPKAKENNMNLLNSKPASNGITIKGVQSIQQQLQKLQQDKPKATNDKEAKPVSESKFEPPKADKDKSPNKKATSDSKPMANFFKPVAKQTSAPAKALEAPIKEKATEAIKEKAPEADVTHAKDATSPVAKPIGKKDAKKVSKKESKKEKEDIMEVDQEEVVPVKEESDREDVILDKSESSSDSEDKEHSESESELSHVDSDARDSDASSKRRKKRAVSPIRATKPKKTEKPKAQPKTAKQEDDETVVIKSASKRKRVVEDSDESDNDIVEEDKPKKKKKAPKQAAPPTQSNTLDTLAVALQQPAVRMKKIKVTKSRINDKGYIVFEDVEEEVPDDSPLPDTPSPAKGNTESMKPKSPLADPDKSKQKKIMSFFRKK